MQQVDCNNVAWLIYITGQVTSQEMTKLLHTACWLPLGSRNITNKDWITSYSMLTAMGSRNVKVMSELPHTACWLPWGHVTSQVRTDLPHTACWLPWGHVTSQLRCPISPLWLSDCCCSEQYLSRGCHGNWLPLARIQKKNNNVTQNQHDVILNTRRSTHDTFTVTIHYTQMDISHPMKKVTKTSFVLFYDLPQRPVSYVFLCCCCCCFSGDSCNAML